MPYATRTHRRLIATFSFIIGFALALVSGSAKQTGSPGLQIEGWPGHAKNSQHTSVSSRASQSLSKIHWHAPVDLQPPTGEIFIHYGSPLVTPSGTVIVPVKTGANSFRAEARNQGSGTVLWRLKTDYAAPSAQFLPSFSPVLANGKVYMPAAGGTVLVRDTPDQATGKLSRLVFYGTANFDGNRQFYSDNVEINTPITADSSGNLYFGFIVLGSTPIALQSGLARISATGQGSYVTATTAANDPQITKVDMSCAPALSHDE